MSWLSWLVMFFASILLIPGAYSIEVGFSAENGGESSSLSSSYDVDIGVHVNEESTASFDQPGIKNTRSVSGTGDIKAVQTYSGSGGYTGSATLSSQGVSGSLRGNAILTPSTLNANQVASLSGNSADVGLDLFHQGESLSMSSGMQSGIIDTNQNTWAGSVEGSQATKIFANSGYVQWAGTLGSSLEKFSGHVQSSLTSFMSLLPGGKVDLQGGKTGDGDYSLSRSLQNPDKSQVKVDVDISDADWFSYSYNLDPDNQYASEKLTANNAKEIKASALASNPDGSSKVSIDVYDGSINDYSNLAHADSTKAESSQKFKSALGSLIDISSTVQIGNFMSPENQMATSSTASIEGSLNGHTNKDYDYGYISSAYSDANKAESTQEAGTGIGHSVLFSSNAEYKKSYRYNVIHQTDVPDLEGEKASVSVDVNEGAIETLEQKATATTNGAKATQTADDAFGSVAEINSHAENMFRSEWTVVIPNQPDIHLQSSSGGANFKVMKKNSDKFGYSSITSTANKNYVDIVPHTSVTKTALMLEPFTFDGLHANHYNSIGSELENVGYAVTQYTDSGVTREKVKKLGDYTISLISTHADPTTLALSRHGEEEVKANELMNWYTNGFHKNEMIILDGCSSFGKPPKTGDISLAEAVKTARLSGGFAHDVIIPTDNNFMDKFFERMCSGNNAKDANDKSALEVWGSEKLLLQGDENYRLFGSSWMVNPGDLIQSYIDKATSGDTITISPGLFNENLVIDRPLNLKGAGSGLDGTIIDGKDSGSVISIIGSPDFNINVLLSNMLIRNGLSTTGGGIYNFDSTLTVDSCRITGNNATQSGGGIYNSGALTVKDSDISENTAKYGGAGICNEYGTFRMDSGTISDNTASYSGGGIYNVEGSSTINGGTISENHAYEGGGIYNYNNDFTMNGGTISENSAHSDTSGLSGSGGGVANNGGTFVLNAGKISDNTADYAGGGVWNSGTAFAMNEGTISGNRASKGGGIATYWGTFEMNGGTISENIAENNVEEGIGGGIYNSKGALTLNGGKISGNDAQKGAGIYNSGTATITDGEISQNIAINDGGGIYNDGTLTFKLSEGTVIPQSDPRVANIVFDNHLGSLNGALNNIAPEILKKWMVNPGEFIQSYIDLANPGDTITIAPGLFDKENLVIDKSITLKGAGSTESGTVIKGLGTDSVFTIGWLDPNINVYLYDLLIRNGKGTLDPSGSYVLGGGISNEGSLTVDHCTIADNGYARGNWAPGPRMYGGGIYSSGDLTVISSTISGNYANAGAGIYLDNEGISPSELKAEITDSIISANIGANGGGGIYNNGGYLTLTGSEITGNGADYYGTGGGGIANMNIGVIEMVSGTVSENSAFDGSGVKNWGTFTMKGGSISRNKAFNAPAGIWATSSGGGIHNSGTFNLEDGSISGNYAYSGGGAYNSGTFNLKGGSINSNVYDASDGSHRVPNKGGGIYNSGTLNIEGGSISSNIAYNDGGGIYNSGKIYPDYSKCSFGTGADANSPNDHN